MTLVLWLIYKRVPDTFLVEIKTPFIWSIYYWLHQTHYWKNIGINSNIEKEIMNSLMLFYLPSKCIIRINMTWTKSVVRLLSINGGNESYDNIEKRQVVYWGRLGFIIKIRPTALLGAIACIIWSGCADTNISSFLRASAYLRLYSHSYCLVFSVFVYLSWTKYTDTEEM